MEFVTISLELSTSPSVYLVRGFAVASTSRIPRTCYERRRPVESNTTRKIEGKRRRGRQKKAEDGRGRQRKATSDVLGKSEQMDGRTNTGGRKTKSHWTGTIENN